MGLTLKQRKLYQQWLEKPLGQTLISTEAKEIKPLISKLFGYHALLIGEAAFEKCLEKSPIQHRVQILPQLKIKDKKDIKDMKDIKNNPSTRNFSSAVSRFDKLPMSTEGLDLIYLAHCLEYHKNPHEVLREAYRSLRPEGSVLISGFNPWSIWGIAKMLVRYIKRMPWDGRFISALRMKDWLALLGFECLELRYYFYRPPVSRATWLERLRFFERVGRVLWPFWGGSYLILAKKKVIPLTMMKSDFLKEKNISPGGVAEPVTNSH